MRNRGKAKACKRALIHQMSVSECDWSNLRKKAEAFKGALSYFYFVSVGSHL